MSIRSLSRLCAFLFVLLSLCSPLLAADQALPHEEIGNMEEPVTPPALERPATPPPPAQTPLPVMKPTTTLSVGSMVICRGIQDRTPLAPGTLFTGDVGKLYCQSLILGAEEETAIHHVWYWKEQKMADVILTVRSLRFRTHSSKKILPHWTGPWRVELQGPNGEILSTAAFNVE